MKQKRYSKNILCIIYFLLLFSTASARNLYVSTTGSNAKDGLSWTNSKQTLAQAVGIATEGDQIWVAAGTYSQTTGINVTIKGVSIYGGFAGFESNLEDRNWLTNKTFINNTGYATNSRLFLIGAGTGVDASNFILDGFILQNGYSNAGGAVSFSGSLSTNMTVSNCIFRNNRSTANSGAIVVLGGNIVSFNNCLFENNEAAGSASIATILGTAKFYNCTFVNNKSSLTSSTAMYLNGTNALVNCIFWNNQNNDGSLSTISTTAATTIDHVASDININYAINSVVFNQNTNPQAQRVINIIQPYLHFGIGSKLKDRRMRFVIDGKTVREFTIQLADGNPDALVFSDVSSFIGKNLRIEVDSFPNPAVLNNIIEADEVPGASVMYQEKYRPQFHFSPRRGWVGDPNGLVYYLGEYHLFYQYNPYGLKWGNMHWGHAVSKDLVHWKEFPITLYPPKFGDDPYSGSAVVDKNNATGFKTGKDDPLVLLYGSTGRGICLSYSNDSGRTFVEYSANPILKGGGGDPKVIWHEPTQQWVMITDKKLLKVNPIAQDWLNLYDCGFDFYTSTDLKNWTHQSRIEDYRECPELFKLPIDGDTARTKWVVYSNTTPSLSTVNLRVGGRYVLGSFDGKIFTEETAKLQFNFGNAYGAAQTFNNVSETDGRRINIGCAFGVQMPGMPFDQMMTFPTELTLHSTEEGIKLYALPVKEIESLYVSSFNFPDVQLTPQSTVLPGVNGDLFDISAEFIVGTETNELGLNIRGIPIVYNVVTNQLICGNRSATLQPIGGTIKLRILVDRTSIEIFANDGRVYMPMAVVPKDVERSISAFSKVGGAKIKMLTVNILKSAWE